MCARTLLFANSQRCIISWYATMPIYEDGALLSCCTVKAARRHSPSWSASVLDMCITRRRDTNRRKHSTDTCIWQIMAPAPVHIPVATTSLQWLEDLLESSLWLLCSRCKILSDDARGGEAAWRTWKCTPPFSHPGMCGSRLASKWCKYALLIPLELPLYRQCAYRP